MMILYQANKTLPFVGFFRCQELIFYQLLTGRNPFTLDASLASLMQVLNTEPPSVLELNDSLPKMWGLLSGR